MKELYKALPVDFDLDYEAVERLYAEGYAFYRAHSYRSAMNVFRLLAGLKPREKRFWNAAAASMQMCGEYKEAIAAYAMVVLSDSELKDPLPHFYAAQCYESLGDRKKGIELLGAAALVAKEQPRYQGLMNQIALLKKSWKKKDR